MLVAGLTAILLTGNWKYLDPTLRFIVPISVMPLVLMFAGSTFRWSERLVDMWLLGAAGNAVVGLLDRFGLTSIGASLAPFDYAGLQDRAAGLTNHPNHFGLVVAMAMPMVIARLLSGGRRGRLALLALPLLVAGLAASGSRGALLAAGGGVLLYLLLAIGRSRSRAGLALMVAMAATVVLLALGPEQTRELGVVSAERFAGQRGATDSDYERRQLLVEAIADVQELPFMGVGYSSTRPAHDIYLQFLQGGGIVALIGFLLFAGSVLRRASALSRATAGIQPNLSALAAGSGASFGVWLLYGLVGPNTYDRYLYLPVGMVLALSLVHWRLAAAPSASSGVMPPLRSHRVAPRSGSRSTATV